MPLSLSNSVLPSTLLKNFVLIICAFCSVGIVFDDAGYKYLINAKSVDLTYCIPRYLA